MVTFDLDLDSYFRSWE